MARSAFSISLVSLAPLFFAGCGSFSCRLDAEPPTPVYGGVQTDLQMLGDCAVGAGSAVVSRGYKPLERLAISWSFGAIGTGLLLDLPLCLVVDTLLAPHEIHRLWERRQADSMKSSEPGQAAPPATDDATVEAR